MDPDIEAYDRSRSGEARSICGALARLIREGLPDADGKVWHGHPVWFLDGNPVVGYSELKGCVRLLFWSGQSFDEAELVGRGKFKAAEVRYTESGQIDEAALGRWRDKARRIQWDYKNIVKRRGQLERLH